MFPPYTETWQAMVFCAIAFAMYMTIKHFSNKKKAVRPLKKNSLPDKTWDDEWLLAEDKKHYVVKIEPTKLVFAFGKPKDNLPQTDGYKAICNCGQVKLGIDLAMAERRFAAHKKEARDKALAEIGRFK